MSRSRVAAPSGRRRVRPARRRWVGVPIAAVLATLVGVVLVLGGTETPDAAAAASSTVATVDGAAVSGDELRFHMARVLPSVSDAAAASGGPSAEDVRRAALTEIGDDDALLDLGRESGLVGFTDFAGFLREVDRTNADRVAAVARGEVVYGLTSYSAAQYYGKVLTDVRTRLIAQLSTGDQPALHVSDAEVAAHLAAHQDEWSANVARFDVTRLTVPATAMGSTTADRLAEIIGAVGDLTTAAGQFPGAVLDTTTVTADAASGSDLSPQTLAQLQSLAIGGTTEPQTRAGGLVVLRLDSVTVDPQEALQQYGTRIRSVLLEAQFEELIAARITAQRTDIRRPGWDAVTLEDLRR